MKDRRISMLVRWTVTLCIAAGIGLAGAAEPVGQPAGYPGANRVSLIVPFAPGGTTDLVARIVAQSLSARWHTAVIVENKAGAGGNIAAEHVSRARPDGLTLLIGATSFANAPALTRQLKYDIAKDFAPVSMIATTPLVLMVSRQSGIRTLPELVAALKKKPDGLNYGSSGIGTSIHLSTLMFLNRLDAKAVHVAYKGSGPALSALASGEIELLFDNYATALPFVTSGQVTGLALTGLERGTLKAPLPTLSEAGFAQFESLTWIGMLAPAGTPKQLVDWLNAEVRAVLQDADTASRFEAMGFSTRPTSPASMQAFIASELAKARRLVKTNAIPIE